MKNICEKHTFVICAYKESPFLEECILSLKNQNMQSNIIMVTSTPNNHIRTLAEKYRIELFVNEGERGIVQDWNFAYHKCNTPYVTIAHQDDIYFSEYTKRAMECLEKSNKPLIYFSDYCEIRNGEKIEKNKLLMIKRILLFPLRFKMLQKSIKARRISLSLGCGICCPSVTFAVKNLPARIFSVRYRSCEDWEAWERLSKYKGEFVYDHRILMGHRIHEGSETSIILGDNARKKEDYEMFCKFWPSWIARILVGFYSKSEKSNDIE